jgi:hypothetical protein
MLWPSSLLAANSTAAAGVSFDFQHVFTHMHRLLYSHTAGVQPCFTRNAQDAPQQPKRVMNTPGFLPALSLTCLVPAQNSHANFPNPPAHAAPEAHRFALVFQPHLTRNNLEAPPYPN